MRILVLGNSHVAALRVAWRQERSRWPRLEVQFAAAHGQGQADLSITNHILAPTSQKVRENMMRVNGRADYDLRDYDAFAISGGTPSIFHAISLYNQARFFGLPSLTGFDPRKSREWSVLSRANFQSALVGLMQNGSAMDIARTLVSTGKPCVILQQLRVSLDCLSQPRKYAGFLRVKNNGDTGVLSQMLDVSSTAAYADLGNVLHQPHITRIHDIFTAPEYRRGATRLTANDSALQPADDFIHGNGKYGTALFDALYSHFFTEYINIR